MTQYNLYVLDESYVTVSGGSSLSGGTSDDGSHLDGQTIILTDNAYELLRIKDNEGYIADDDSKQRLSGEQELGGVRYANNSEVQAEYTVTVSDGTNTYTMIGFNIDEDGSGAEGTTEALAFLGSFPPIGVPLTVVSTSDGPPNSGGGATPAGNYATPPCFASGTLIGTPDGPVPVEQLTPGRLVLTRDSGPTRLAWTGRVHVGRRRLAATPSLRPVRIRAHAFGPDLPARDLVVSQQHRILVRGSGVCLATGETEALAAAVHLIDGERVVLDRAARSVTYHPLLFDRHEIVLSEGLETESFLPGPTALASIPGASRDELMTLFPELRQGLAPSALEAARPILKRHEASLLAA